MSTTTPPVALAIAGVDPGGGAGILADVSTFAAMGVHAAAVVTALTAQGSRGVSHVHVPPLGTLLAQMEAVLEHLPLAAVKVGMLGDAPTARYVAEQAVAGRLPHLVVDPVMGATLGGSLIDDDGATALRDELVPHAEVLTPNRFEAGILVGQVVTSDDDALEAALELGRHGPRCVVITGGDATGDTVVDVVAIDGVVRAHRAPRIDTANNHGTGCTFAAALTAQLALGAQPAVAVAVARAFVRERLTAGATWRLGSVVPVPHVFDIGTVNR